MPHGSAAKLSHKLSDFLEDIAHLPYTPIGYTALVRSCTFQCGACDTLFYGRPYDVRAGVTTCPGCKARNYEKAYVQRLSEVYPHITLVGPYNGCREGSKHRCSCGNTWVSIPLVTKNTISKKGCSVCDYRAGGPRLKSTKFGGHDVWVQGYEHFALAYLEQRGVNTRKLCIGGGDGVPNITYRWRGSKHRYYPDFYYIPKNRIVEVKSVFTLLSVDFGKTCAKAKACLALEYNFSLLLIVKNRRKTDVPFTVLHVPHDWYEYSRSGLATYLLEKYPRKTDLILRSMKAQPYR